MVIVVIVIVVIEWMFAVDGRCGCGSGEIGGSRICVCCWLMVVIVVVIIVSIGRR
ncbi:hypothetical protein D3C80_2150530 [compost metagenome]